MRQQIEILEIHLKKIIAMNLKRLIIQKGFSQTKLSEKSGIPQSTISDIIKEKFLVNAGKVQKLADALNVNKSEIDPSFQKCYDQKEILTSEKFEALLKIFSAPAHLDIALELLDEIYFEGQKLNKEDIEKIKEIIRLVIINKKN